MRTLFVWGAVGVLSACAGTGPAGPERRPTAAPELVLYHRQGALPVSVLEAFEIETGVSVRAETYRTQDEAVAELRRAPVIDLAVLETDRIPALAEDGLLADIDYRNVPNFRNISANFRDLAYDPGNEHSVPFSWGTTGLVVRPDLVEQVPTRWADLWNPAYRGRVAVRDAPRDLIGATLLSLGYSINSENSTELAVAEGRLMRLKDWLLVADPLGSGGVDLLAEGRVHVLVGRADDVLAARGQGLEVAYVLPQEGTILWGNNFVIPRAAAHKALAERFIDFVLRPQIGAAIANANHYAAPNEPARAFIRPEILRDAVVNPSDEMLRNAAINLPLSPAALSLHEAIWRGFRQVNG